MRRWLRTTLLAGGCPHERLPLDDAVDAAAALLATGRATPPHDFAPDLFGHSA